MDYTYKDEGSQEDEDEEQEPPQTQRTEGDGFETNRQMLSSRQPTQNTDPSQVPYRRG